MKDILLSPDGDMILKDEDIVLEESLCQRINILLRWFEGEWQWDDEQGLPYFDDLFIKNPNTDSFEDAVRDKLYEIDEIIDIPELNIEYGEDRVAKISYTVVTDQETIESEVEIYDRVRNN